MGIGAIVLGVFAIVCAIAGVLLFWVPFLGAMISFLAPVLALVGTILGGIALSRSRSGGGESEGLAIGGLITSLVALIPSVIVALSCGACNVCATGMYLDPDFARIDAGPHAPDAGYPSNPAIAPPPFPSTPPPFPPSTAAPPTTIAPAPNTATPTTSPGVMAPPPLPSSAGT